MNITFRKLTIKDLSHRMKWLNDPEVNKYLSTRVRSGTDEEFHKKWFKNYSSDETREIFTIEVDNEPVGQVGLININTLDKNASLYIMIGEKAYWNKSIGSKSIEFILEHGFSQLKLHKIWLDVHAENKTAIKLYEKFGFTQEGLFKDQIQYGDHFSDEIRMAKFQNQR